MRRKEKRGINLLQVRKLFAHFININYTAIIHKIKVCPLIFFICAGKKQDNTFHTSYLSNNSNNSITIKHKKTAFLQ